MPEPRKILINQKFTSTQSEINSNLALTDDYYSYQQTSLGGGITNEFNVRQFLSDSTNDDIGNDFFNFLTANTTIQELLYSGITEEKFEEVTGSKVPDNKSVTVRDFIIEKGLEFGNVRDKFTE